MNKLEAYWLCDNIEEEVNTKQNADPHVGGVHCSPDLENQFIEVNFMLKDAPRYVYESMEQDMANQSFWDTAHFITQIYDKWTEIGKEDSINRFYSFIKMGETYGWD